jgi:ABC-type branched-subunit amino acid transport system substrate-binding protein
MRARRRCFWSLLLVLTVTLSACRPAGLPRVVKIGLAAPFEGQHRSLGYDAIYAARLAVREINAQGGVGGRYLELVAYDDRADPTLARTVARNLAIDPDVVAVIGAYQQRTLTAAAPLYAEAGLPLIAMGGWVTATTGPVWHLAPPPARLANAMVHQAEGVSRAASIVVGDGPLVAPLRAEIAGATGQSISATLAARFSVQSPVEAAEQVRAWRAEGWRGEFIGGPALLADAFSEVAEEAIESGAGARAITPYPLPQDLPDLAAWTAAYRAVGPHAPAPNFYALPTYEAVYLIAAAIEQAARPHQPLTRGDLQAALPDVRRSGALGEIAWDAAGHWAAAPLYAYEWTSGRPALIEVIAAP